jgi:glycosyltransferase involved in cell wall biosynthesis
MAAGKAMVVGIGRHTRFLPLRDRENALLVPPSDPEAILSAVLELQQDRDLRQRIGQAAGEYARRYMDYSVVAARYLDILRDVIGIGALR